MAKAWIKELDASGCEITIEFMNGKRFKGRTDSGDVTHWGYNLSGLIQCCSDGRRTVFEGLSDEAVAYYKVNKAAEDKHYFKWLIEQNKAQIAELQREIEGYEEILGESEAQS